MMNFYIMQFCVPPLRIEVLYCVKLPIFTTNVDAENKMAIIVVTTVMAIIVDLINFFLITKKPCTELSSIPFFDSNKLKKSKQYLNSKINNV